MRKNIGHNTGLRLKQSVDIIASEVDGEIVMMSIDHGKYFGLDSVGTDIWLLLKEPKSFTELSVELSKIYNTDIKVIERDLMPFLEDLLENDILESVS